MSTARRTQCWAGCSIGPHAGPHPVVRSRNTFARRRCTIVQVGRASAAREPAPSIPAPAAGLAGGGGVVRGCGATRVAGGVGSAVHRWVWWSPRSRCSRIPSADRGCGPMFGVVERAGAGLPVVAGSGGVVMAELSPPHRRVDGKGDQERRQSWNPDEQAHSLQGGQARGRRCRHGDRARRRGNEHRHSHLTGPAVADQTRMPRARRRRARSVQVRGTVRVAGCCDATSLHANPGVVSARLLTGRNSTTSRQPYGRCPMVGHCFGLVSSTPATGVAGQWTCSS